MTQPFNIMCRFRERYIFFCSLFLILCFGLGCQKKEGPATTPIKSITGIQKLNVLNPGFFTHQAIARSIFVAGSDGKIIVQTPKNQQWSAANTPDINNKITALAADDSGTKILAVGEQGLIAYSEDSGLNWRKRPSPTTKTLTALAFDSKHQRWILAGEQGLLLYSDLTGSNWQQAPLNSAATFSKIISLPTQLIAIGENGLIANSRDGGNTWKIAPAVSSAALTDIVAVGNQVFISSADGNLVRGDLATTSREPNNWTHIPTGFSSYLSRIFYHRQQKLLLCLSSEGNILLSDDGGNLWAPVSQQNPYLNDIAQSNDGKFLLVVGDQGQILSSDNAGRTWTKKSSPTGTNIEGVIAYGASGFIAYGEAGLLMQLNNIYSEWEIINYPVGEFVHQLFSETPDNWIAVGAKGTMLSSANQGKSWQAIDTPAQESDYFLSLIADKKSGNLIAAGPPGTILTSNKNTTAWQLRLALNDANQGYFHRLAANDQGTVVAIAGPGTTHYSPDSGGHWYPANIDNAKQLFNVIYDQYHQQFIAVGQQGSIQLSPDGKDWTQITTSIQQSLQTVYATQHSLWAAGDAGVLIQSTDGGKTWQSAHLESQASNLPTNNPPATLLALFETQHGSVIASGTQGFIARLPFDGENNWQQIESPTRSSLRTPVQDQATGFIYVPGKAGEIIYSRDDGLSWTLLPPVTQGSIKSLYIDNSNNMLIGVGERLIRIPLLTRND